MNDLVGSYFDAAIAHLNRVREEEAALAEALEEARRGART